MDTTPTPSEQQLLEALREIEHLKQQLEECSLAKRTAIDEMQQFVYAVSHDLRAPLRGIFSYAQLLQRQHAQDEQTTEMTSFILGGAQEMNTLIEDLLKYSRTGNSPRRTMVNLGALAQWAWANLQAQVRETAAQITYSDLPEVSVDESEFVQVFQQLFSNALKFRSREAPQLEVTAEENEAEYVISVRDNGSGIDPKYQDTVFTPFKRLHGKSVPGTGLGLSLCRKIVRAHGGRIWIESDGKNGSLFKFTVPV